MLSKKVKIELDYSQELILNTLSNEHRLLYNYLLEKTKTTTDFKILNETYKNYRLGNNLTISSKSAQNTCISLINSILSYYELKKIDKTAKFPYKFKSWKYFQSFMLDSNKSPDGKLHGGFKIENNKLIVNLLSAKKTAKRLIIDLPEYVSDINNSNIKTITFSKDDLTNEYFISFVYQEQSKIQKLNKENYLGIDLGYSTLLTGVSKEENIKISNYKQKKLLKYIEEIQSKRDKCKKGSKRHKKLTKTYRKLHKKRSNKQKDFQHKTSKKIVDYCINKNIGKVVVGELEVKCVIKNKIKELKKFIKLATKQNNEFLIHKYETELAVEYGKMTLNKDSKLSSIGRFMTFLEYKMRNAGIEFILQNEAFTSKINCLTNKIEFDSGLDNRYFDYNFNGNIIKIDRDINSGINILTKSGLWLSQEQKFVLLNNSINKLNCY